MKDASRIAYDYFLSLIKGTEHIIKTMRDQPTDQLNTLSGQIGMLDDMIDNMKGLREDLKDVLKHTTKHSSS